MLDGLCNNVEFDEVIVMFREMESDGLVLNVVSYSILIDGMCEVGRFKDVLDFFFEFMFKGL